jgi:hypothetical protein
MIEYLPPHPINLINNHKSVFLAGTIDMGNSVDWQKKVVKHYKDTGINIYNPRRSDWDASWEQSITNAKFVQQVSWELQALEQADYIIVNFLEDSKSPVTLFELGLHVHSGKVLVCSPEKFYRNGNIEIICATYNVPLFRTLNKLLDSADKYLLS